MRSLAVASMLVLGCSGSSSAPSPAPREAPEPAAPSSTSALPAPPADPPPPPPPPAASAAPCVAATPGAGDVVVAIAADQGPHGGGPVRIDRKAFGLSIADWRPDDYVPQASGDFLARLVELAPGVLRWPAGHRSQEYVWTRGGAGQTGDWELTPGHVDAFLALARAAKAEVLLAVNVKRGTPAAAADLVRYVNVEKQAHVGWIQIGNEPDLVDAMTPGPAAYADELVRFTDAIRAVDPTVRFVGPEMMTGAHVGGIDGTLDWMTPILAQGGDRLAAVSWHYYPLDSGQALASSSARPSIPHLFQEVAPDWHPAGLGFADLIMPMLAAKAPGKPVWITELAEDPGPRMGAGLSDTIAAAIWTTDALGRYLGYGPGAVLRWLYKGDREHVYALLDVDDRPRPVYAAWWLHAKHFGDRVVKATSSDPTVAVHAALRDDGALAIVLANETDAPRHVSLGASAFCARSASGLVVEGSSLDATSFTVDGAPLGVPGPEPRSLPDASAVDLPAASIALVLLRP